MVQNIPVWAVHVVGGSVSLAGVLLFWWLASRRVAAEDAVRQGPQFVQRIARNTAVPLMSLLVTRSLSWVFAAYYLRLLGPENNGFYTVAVNLIGYFGPLTDFGLGVLLTREASRKPEETSRYFQHVLHIRLLLSLAALPLVLLIILAYWASGQVPADTVLTTVLLGLALVPANLAGTASAVFAARERMDYTALVQIATALLTIGLGILALTLGMGYVGLGVTSLVANAVTAWVLHRTLPPEATQRAAPLEWRTARLLLLASLPLMLTALLNGLFFRIDVQVLLLFQGSEVVGHYGAAYKFIEAFALLPSTLVLALFPALSRQAVKDRAALARAVTKALHVLQVVAVGSAVAVSAYAFPLVRLFFGDQYLPHAATALAILIWFLPLSYVNGLTQYVLIALNQQRWITLAFALATAFNLGANLLVVPTYSYVGAAVTTIASELVILVPFWLVAWRSGLALPVVECTWRPLVAGAAALALVWLGRDLFWLLSAVLAGMAYLAVVVLTGALPRQDIALVWHAVRRRAEAETASPPAPLR
jgi:O-antigen/teichoic acid export membrane protein